MKILSMMQYKKGKVGLLIRYPTPFFFDENYDIGENAGLCARQTKHATTRAEHRRVHLHSHIDKEDGAYKTLSLAYVILSLAASCTMTARPTRPLPQQ